MGPAAKPAKPGPTDNRTSSASTGTSLAQGLPCMSTNMAKKNSTPSCFAFDLSSSSTSDIRASSLAPRSRHLYAGGSPGIQFVPASGTFAIAAASTVSATRSSGSRLWTLDLPHARARAVSSIVIALR